MRPLLITVALVALMSAWLFLGALAPPPWDHTPLFMLIGLVALFRLNAEAGFGLLLAEGALNTVWISHTWFALPLAALLAFGLLWMLRQYMTHLSIYAVFGLSIVTVIVWIGAVSAFSIGVMAALTEAIWVAVPSALIIVATLSFLPKSSVRL